MLIATQRLSTVGVADRAVVLDDGRVVEQGTPAELLAAGGLFTAALRRGVRCRIRQPHRALAPAPATLPSARARVAVIALLAALSAAAPVAGWLLVQDAIDNGIAPGDEHRLMLAVIGYLAVNAAAWVLGTLTWLGLASVGQRIVLGLRRDLFDHLTTLSLRYFSQQKAGWIIARLTSDVDALSDVLSQGLTTLVVNTLTLVAAVCRALHPRLAARARRARASCRRRSSSRAGSSASRTRRRSRCGPGSRS